MARLEARLRARGLEVVATREPGGTGIGERIRAVALDAAPGAAMAAETELALMAASRAQNVREQIAPALARGAWVLCDRFHDATEAYQGGGRGLDRAAIRELHRLLCGGLEPARTLLFELAPAESLARARRRRSAAGEGRFEAEDLEFFERVARAYGEIAAREPERVRVIDASGTVEAVEARVWAAAEELLARPARERGHALE